MATYAGKDGVVKLGGTAIGEVKNWSVDISVETLESTVMGSDYREKSPSYISWSGSVDVYYDDADTVQDAVWSSVTSGSELALLLYPRGESAGETLGGQVVVTGMTQSAAFDGMVERTISFEGSGAHTFAAV